VGQESEDESDLMAADWKGSMKKAGSSMPSRVGGSAFLLLIPRTRDAIIPEDTFAMLSLKLLDPVSGRDNPLGTTPII
jgi:hypothetical protein